MPCPFSLIATPLSLGRFANLHRKLERARRARLWMSWCSSCALCKRCSASSTLIVAPGPCREMASSRLSYGKYFLSFHPARAVSQRFTTAQRLMCRRSAIMTPIRMSPGERTPTAELRAWVQERLDLDPSRTAELLDRIDEVVARQRALLEESKYDAMRALSEGFATKMETFQRQLSEKDITVSNIARYFEDVVADLTERSHRDPKTKLLNFDWFMERLESYLAVEQRVRWCGVGVVDINSFKWYNDTLGHAVGDKIIEGVAGILADQIRSEDFLAVERGTVARDLHARFGGDEFCFLIPDLPGCGQAMEIAGRFKSAVEQHDWSREDRRVTPRPAPGGGGG